MEKQSTRRRFLSATAATAASLMLQRATGAASEHPLSGRKPNVLFIAVDDLRPQLHCFGHKQIISPNIDRLAASGLRFERCYCQVPVCGASRASLLTGVRPTRKRFVSYDTWADKDLPGNLSLPRHFKNSGYITLSRGKIYHHKRDGEGSWSEEAWGPKRKNGNWRDYQHEENRKVAATNKKHAGPPFENADVPDNAYGDGKIAEKGIEDLRKLKQQDKPFFLALGFLKPHLPFNSPRRYWEMYQREEIDLADNPFKPKNAPRAALHNWGELRAYHGIPKKGPLTDEQARTLVHGYYACVSYTDAQIGKVLDELDRLKLRENTIVVLWGDHGWNLREHGLWCKHCNFETSLRAPLIISAPGFAGGKKTSALSEFTDIYPTLCELAGLPLPQHLDGKSVVPLLHDPDRKWKDAVYSRYFNGTSVRTDRYRYTRWRRNRTQYARMLYDHKRDPGENVNIAEDSRNRPLVKRFNALIDTIEGGS